MSDHDRDDLPQEPLDSLKAAWEGLEAPEATPDQGDAQTDAALDWMRGAWDALEAPALELPASLRRKHPLRISRSPLAWMAAAAALMLGAWLYQALPAGLSSSAPNQQELALLPSDPGPTVAPSTPSPLRLVQSDAPEEGIVLTHGSVRLVLLTNTEESFLTPPPSGTTAEPDFGSTKK